MTRRPLLLWIMLLVAVAVGAVVALAELDDTAGLVLACVALLTTALATVLLVRDELDEDEPRPSHDRALPRPALVATALAVVALAVAVASEAGEAARTATAPDGPREAAQTARNFLGAALIRGDGEAACGYLTPAEQARVASRAADGRTCRAVIDGLAAPPAVSPRQLADLPVRAARTSRGMRVTVDLPDGPATLVLRAETPAERLAFDSPPGVWRIASGAAALLTP